MGVSSIGGEPGRLNAERLRQLHTPQVTMVSLAARLVLGDRIGRRFDRCRYRRCRQRWGRHGCTSHRDADAAISALREATSELPIVVGIVHLGDPFGRWEVRAL